MSLRHRATSALEAPSHQVQGAPWDSAEGYAGTPSSIPSTASGGKMPVRPAGPKGLSCEDPVDLSEDRVSIAFSLFSVSIGQGVSLPTAFEEVSSQTPPQGWEEQLTEPGPVDPASVGTSSWPSGDATIDLECDGPLSPLINSPWANLGVGVGSCRRGSHFL